MTKDDDNESAWYEQARSIFNYAPPPSIITQRQADHCQEDLQSLIEVDIGVEGFDRCYYLLYAYLNDLAVSDLQKDLFHYAFPICLTFWAKTLHCGERCGRGDMEFHQALDMGSVLDNRELVSAEQKTAIEKFFVEGLVQKAVDLNRLWVGEDEFVAWLDRVSGVALICDCIPPLFQALWRLPGQRSTDCTTRLIELLVRPRVDGPRLYPQQCGAIESRWREMNSSFLSRFLSFERVTDKLRDCTQDEAAELRLYVCEDRARFEAYISWSMSSLRLTRIENAGREFDLRAEGEFVVIP
jgi:hypothetical protein